MNDLPAALGPWRITQPLRTLGRGRERERVFTCQGDDEEDEDAKANVVLQGHICKCCSRATGIILPDGHRAKHACKREALTLTAPLETPCTHVLHIVALIKSMPPLQETNKGGKLTIQGLLWAAALKHPSLAGQAKSAGL